MGLLVVEGRHGLRRHDGYNIQARRRALPSRTWERGLVSRVRAARRSKRQSGAMSGPYLSDDYRDALEDFRERRELQGLGDSDGLGSDPTLEPPSLALRDPLPDWKRAGLM